MHAQTVPSQGGKDAASARYIFTQLSPITRFLFPKDDDKLLNYLNEDGQSIEPTWHFLFPFKREDFGMLIEETNQACLTHCAIGTCR